MSYLVLARKLRPQTFAEVVGQGTIVRTLQNAIRKNRIAHAMIFSGVRGIGKTTLARLMAKAMNCEQPNDPPCNQCPSCKEISAGVAVDLHEIDGASNRGIQEIRELKENIRFQPAQSPYKIVIIDEVHMLTNEAFNALLKTLEEPPEHVYFMFATTELHKVPVTILSRCQRYELKRVSSQDLSKFFKKIVEAESVEMSDSAVAMIVREAAGSVRDGLSLLDQIISFGGAKISDLEVTEVLGLVDGQVYANIATGVLAKNLAICLQMLNDTQSQGVSLKRFSVDLLAFFRALIIAKIDGGSSELLDVPDQEKIIIQNLASQYSSETLVKNFQILMKGVEELQYASQPKMVLEVAFMKMIALGDIVNAATLIERLATISGADGAENMALSEGNISADLPPESVAASVEEKSLRQTITPSEGLGELRTGKSEKKQIPAKVEERTTGVDGSPEVEVMAHVKEKDVRKDWDGFIAHIKERKPWMAHALSLCQNAKEDGQKLILKYDAASECTVLQGSENIKLLSEFTLDFFQKDLKVTIVVKSGKAVSDEKSEANIPQEERRALVADPLVLLTTEVLDGQVSGIRTGPRSR